VGLQSTRKVVEVASAATAELNDRSGRGSTPTLRPSGRLPHVSDAAPRDDESTQPSTSVEPGAVEPGAVEPGAVEPGGATGLEELLDRVRALASGEGSDRSPKPSPFAAAEARALAMTHAAPPHSRDLADAALTFAADALVALVIHEGRTAVEDCAPLVESVANVSGLSPDAAAFSLYLRAIANPSILALAPRVAAEVHLRLLFGLAPLSDVSLWVEELSGRVSQVASVGAHAATRRCRSVAVKTIAGNRSPADGDDRSQLQGVAVVRWERPVGAVVARSRPEHRARVSVFLVECAAMLASVLERDLLLGRSASREQQLHQASERRLLRVGFDLHDGPLQDIAAFANDLRLAREQLSQTLTGPVRSIMLGRFDDLDGRLAEIDQTLRELSQSLESSSVGTSSLTDTLRRELAVFDRRSGIEATLEVSGSFDSLSASQRIALFRIAQEGLANVREHASATKVSVRLEALADGVRLAISDDGDGFDVSNTVVAAARRGRLGLVGMSERVRLLGGSFSLTSSFGSGTQIIATLPSWDPVNAVREPAVQVATV
jgi:signal transduction histidine kinase